MMAKENEDCYFYYYSTCRKGSSCSFRHEPLSRGTEATCEDWEFGRCTKKHCELRHMRIEVNRSAIACYWETQPAGCQKAHCAFRHATPKSAATPVDVNTSVEVKNAPSPKLDQILIHTADTDEDSPHKKVRVKPAVKSADPVKKVALNRHLGNKTNHTEVRQNSLTDAKPSSQILEEELIEFAKKGVRTKPDLDVYQAPSPVNPATKTKKSLKELKREKILRAKLEYERKKLAASQQLRVTNVVAPTPTVKSPTSTPSNGSKESKPLTNTTRSPVKRGLPSGTVSKEMEVPRMNTNSDGEVRVKSFDEIMEEKRQRLAVQTDSGTVEAPEKKDKDVVKKTDNNTFSKPNRPIVAARKIKLRPTSNNTASKRKPIRLKRSGPTPLKVEAEPKNEKIEELSSLSDECVVQTSSSVEPHTADNEQSVAADVKEPVLSDDHLKQKSLTNSREVEDVGDELDLLGESYELKSGSYNMSEDISDDDLMNEMEQLLA